ncbi:MAG: sugar phosphate nucleotidyltransferase [Pseudomonadota bacterium]
MTKRKGILLAGGTGSRLFPLTHAVSKQLLPVYDKPMIFYPLSLLINSGIDEIVIITTPAQRASFEACLGDGRAFGITLKYIVQPSPDGLAQAYLLAERFLDGAPSMMVLGDNLFCGPELEAQITQAASCAANAVFGYPVLDPQNYGVANTDVAGRVTSIVEKPELPVSDLAVTGLYLLDGEASERARSVRPSMRGELEITDLLQTYLEDGRLEVVRLENGRWFDTGAPLNLLDASNYVRNQLAQHNRAIGSPELAAFRRGLISVDQLLRRAASMHQTEYGHLLKGAAVRGVSTDPSLLATSA